MIKNKDEKLSYTIDVRTNEIYQMLSLSIIKLIKERGDIYDKKRNISICYYITSTCYNNIITS